MARTKAARTLDELVTQVYHVDLWDCRSCEQFQQGLKHIIHNMDLLLRALAGCHSEDSRTRRAVDDVKLKASRLLVLCREAPAKFEHPEGWRDAARRIVANYEVLRVDAGHLYERVVPNSPIGVLRSAL